MFELSKSLNGAYGLNFNHQIVDKNFSLFMVLIQKIFPFNLFSVPGESEDVPLRECGVDAHDGQGEVDQPDLQDQPNQRRARGRGKLVRAETLKEIRSRLGSRFWDVFLKGGSYKLGFLKRDGIASFLTSFFLKIFLIGSC